MIELKNVTIICCDCYNYGAATAMLQKAITQVKAERVIFLTDIYLQLEGIEVIEIPTISNKNEYSRFIIKELYKYFDTSHCLVMQHDTSILYTECWDDTFLDYDYIGSKWGYPKGERNVGNGGFSLRSKKLLTAIAKDDFIKATQQEDDVICRLYGEYLEITHDIKFASQEIADTFSFELIAPTQKTFGHHGYFRQPFKEHIVLKRTAAMGDVIMLEPVMEYFHNQGYQVVLDTLPHFFNLFSEHYFHVIHISKLNPEIKPQRVINFDMAYEIIPLKPVLQSYFDIAGIKDVPLKNSRLNILRGGDEKFFDKYAVIHIDSTSIPHRDVNGVDWKEVVKHLEEKGYTVFQIGKRMDIKVATYFNTMTIELLMYFIKKCDLFIGIDSGNLQIAQAFNVKSIGFFGSVNPIFRYTNFDKLIPLHTKCLSEEHEFCYHKTNGSVVGKECVYNKTKPPCTQFKTETLIEAINKIS
mgnify:CR=1 FL=1|tara:strand:+ start:4342 stop:5751 length:1410 start_codon:yes stop_codon:yes gene_type:complete